MRSSNMELTSTAARKGRPYVLPGEMKMPWEESSESHCPERVALLNSDIHVGCRQPKLSRKSGGRWMAAPPYGWSTPACSLLGADKHRQSTSFLSPPPSASPSPDKGEDLGHVYRSVAAFVQGTHMNAVLRLTTALISFYKPPISVQALSRLTW